MSAVTRSLTSAPQMSGECVGPWGAIIYGLLGALVFAVLASFWLYCTGAMKMMPGEPATTRVQMAQSMVRADEDCAVCATAINQPSDACVQLKLPGRLMYAVRVCKQCAHPLHLDCALRYHMQLLSERKPFTCPTCRSGIGGQMCFVTAQVGIV